MRQQRQTRTTSGQDGGRILNVCLYWNHLVRDSFRSRGLLSLCVVPVVRGEVRGQGVELGPQWTLGLVSLPSCALSLLQTLLSPLLYFYFTFTFQTSQPVLTLVRILWPGIGFKLILCRQPARRPFGFDWIIFCVSASNIVLHAGCLRRSKL